MLTMGCGDGHRRRGDEEYRTARMRLPHVDRGVGTSVYGSTVNRWRWPEAGDAANQQRIGRNSAPILDRSV